MIRVLIIGGAGFVGSHLVDLCLENSCRVLVFDNFSIGRREFLQDHPALRIEEGDILDRKNLVATVLSFDPDIVYHLAAIHHIPTCEKEPEQALRVNIEGTQSVLTACATKTNVPRIVFASTGALYDPKTEGGLHEEARLRAQNIYSISKLTGEQLMEYHTVKTGDQVVVARLFNVVGRRETNPHIIPTIMAQLSQGSRQIALGNLHPRRDYIHVKDVANALFLLGNSGDVSEQRFEVFNIGSGQEYSVRELVELCSEVIGEPIEVISDPQRQRKADRPSQLADIRKIQRATSWGPTRNLRQALAEIWEETLNGHIVLQA